MSEQSKHITLHTESLSVGYKESSTGPVLSNLDISVEKGKLVSFMGPNGIGKTTLLRTLAGLMKPLGGKIFLGSKEIDQIPPAELAKQISVVLTDPILAGGISVLDLVGMGRYPYTNWFMKFTKEDIKIVESAIHSLGLEDLRTKKINELSDGQRQKALIARALAQDGDLLILDEPNSHLDLNNRIEIMRILRRMAGQTGKSILVATHELDLALQTSDSLWLATNNGRIINGVPEDLVLSNAFDEVFDTKGFDLKTGRVVHEFKNGKKVDIVGSGYLYLWTRNALERNGIEISPDSDVKITILEENQQWRISQKGEEKTVNSVEELLKVLATDNG